jgi:hypothetical protein
MGGTSRLVLALPVSLMASGCSGTSPMQACTDLANATCNLYSSCSAGYYIALEFGDLPTCVSRYQANCEARLALASALSATQTEACAQALPSESCADLYGNNPVAACRAPDGGTAAGDVCTLSAQCQTAYCATPKNTLCGTCAAPLASGEDCSELPCGAGLVCLRATSTCGTPSSDGGPCVSEGDCQFGLACLEPFGDGGFCVPAGTLGGTCDPAKTTGPVCPARLGLYCSAVSADGGTCTALAGTTVGQPCGNVAGVGTICQQSGTCQRVLPDSGMGVCVGYAADGTACDNDGGPQCLPLSRCVPSTDAGTSGICRQPAAVECQ